MDQFYSVPPQTYSVSETVVEKSRFITTVARVDSVDEAVAVLKAVRKKYYDATHN